LKIIKVSTETSPNTLYVPLDTSVIGNELSALFSELSTEDIVSMQVTEMSIDDYHNLPEFEGW